MLMFFIGLIVGIPVGVIVSMIIADIIISKKIKEASRHTAIRGKNGFSVELLPCPHCGSNDLELMVGGNDSYAIKCNNCKTQTAYFESAVDLVKIWNARVEGINDFS